MLTVVLGVQAGYDNDWDRPLSVTCGSRKSINRIYSTHDNGKEDRRWDIECSNLPGVASLLSLRETCSWTSRKWHFCLFCVNNNNNNKYLDTTEPGKGHTSFIFNSFRQLNMLFERLNILFAQLIILLSRSNNILSRRNKLKNKILMSLSGFRTNEMQLLSL